MTNHESAGRLLLIGASRGLGHAMAAEFAKRGWHVVGTVRGDRRTMLHDLANQCPGQIDIEQLDMCDDAQIDALAQRLAGQTFDMLFVNAGITNRDPSQTVHDITTEEFVEVMTTNALAPMRVIGKLDGSVPDGGLIGVMTSGQGSIGNNEKGGRELYRGSKAALNMFMRSYAARTADAGRTLLCMAPGWIRTALGGPAAPFGIDDNIPPLVDTMLAARGTPGLQYLDYRGRSVPW